MARKVFISVLGAGYYGECKYCRGKQDPMTGKFEFESTNTRFVQQATLEFLRNREEWTENDVVLIALTVKATSDNWIIVDKEGIQNRRYNSRIEGFENYKGLKQILSEMRLKCQIEEVPIPDGKDETEMWEVFSNLYGKLEIGDQLYIDLTHSFRYLPMLLLVLSNYSKTLKNISVRHISYGNYETRDQSVVPNKAQLMNILPLSRLQDWTFAATDLIKNGNVKRLAELSNSNSLTPLLRSMGKKTEERQAIEESFNGYVTALQKLISDLKLCQGPDLFDGTSIYDYTESYNKVKELLPQYIKDPSKQNQKDKGIISPIPPIIESIHQTFSGWETTATKKTLSVKKTEKAMWTWKHDKDKIGIRNGYKAAKWCYDYQLYQQAVTILQENITTEFCLLLGSNHRNYKEREEAVQLLLNGYRGKSLVDIKVKAFRDKYAEMFNDIVNIRNSYNHAGMTKQLSPKAIENLKTYIEKALNLQKM